MNIRERLGLALGRDLRLGTIMDRLAALGADRHLVTEPAGPEEGLTYGEAAARVATWSDAVAGRIEPGQRVVVALPNGYGVLLACLAVCRAGGVAVPLNPQMRPAEIDHVVADSGAAFVVRQESDLAGEAAGAEWRRVKRDAVHTHPSAVAGIFYTSGTTGAPKGARLTHRALLSQLAPAAAFPSGLRRDEAVAALPVAHIMGFAGLLGLAIAGIPVYFLPRFRPDNVLDAIEQRRATIFVGVPAMYRLLLEAGAEDRDLRSVRVWLSGADVMPADLARRFQRMGATATLPMLGRSVGQALFVEGYGMVEVAGGVAVKVAPPLLPVPGDFLGVPLPRYRLRVAGEDGRDVPPGRVGELWVRGPGILEGYHGDEEATRQAVTPDGWLRTGDLARRGPFGLVFFEGRSKDVIKHGGYSVYALEVERALEEHPDVAEAAVTGLPDERKGEVPVAAVRLREGAAATEDDLLRWAGERLAEYKVPQRLRIVDDLPRTGTDKVQKRELLGLFA